MLQTAAEATYEDGSSVYRFLGEGDVKPLMIDTEQLPMEARPPEDLSDWEMIAADNLEEHMIAGGISILITGFPGTGKNIHREKANRKAARRGEGGGDHL